MHLSVFDNDTLGNYEGAYNLHLRIDGNVPSGGLLFDDTPVRDRIWERLRQMNFIVDNVANVGGVFQWGYSYDLFLQVWNEFSPEEVKANVVRDLAGTFNVTGISVISSNRPAGGGQQGGGQQGTINNYYGTPNAGLPGANASGRDDDDDDDKEFDFSAFLTGMGSGGLIAGVVLLVVLLKK